MTTTVAAPTTREGEVLLVRLLPTVKQAHSASTLRKSLSPLWQQPLDMPAWNALVDELVEAGLILRKPIQLTEAGRARALELLGLAEPPPNAKWTTLRDRYLLPKVLGLTEAVGKPAMSLDKLGAAVLARRHNLPAGTSRTLSSALEALACKELGFPEEATLEAVRDRVLGKLLGIDERLPKLQLGKLLAQQATAARNVRLQSLRDAVLGGWLHPARDEEAPEPFDLSAFAATVQAEARACPTGRFGDNKVFIHHVWNALRTEPGFRISSLAEFKKRLVEANQAGLLHLSRADLVQAMDPVDVQQSETRFLDALFHFVLIERSQP